jgi:hypothetical protein
VVEHPVSSYLQWELNLFRVRHEDGEQIRILRAEAIRQLEARRPLPELVILGTQVMYEVLYDSTGVLAGGRRIDEPTVIATCREDMSQLYDMSEDLLPYFESEIARLPAPEGTAF